MRRLGNNTASVLCSRWDGSWEVRKQIFFVLFFEFVTLMYFKCSACAGRHNKICLQCWILYMLLVR